MCGKIMSLFCASHPPLMEARSEEEAASLLSGGCVWCLDGRVGDTADLAGSDGEPGGT